MKSLFSPKRFTKKKLQILLIELAVFGFLVWLATAIPLIMIPESQRPMTDALMCLRDAKCQAQKDGVPAEVISDPNAAQYSACWGYFRQHNDAVFKAFEKKPEQLAKVKADALENEANFLRGVDELGCFKGPKYWAYKISGQF